MKFAFIKVLPLINLFFGHFIVSFIFRKYLGSQRTLSKDNSTDITGLLQKLKVNPTVSDFKNH